MYKRQIEYWIFHRTDRLKSGRRPLSFLLTLAAVIGVIIIAMYIIVPQIAETMARRISWTFSFRPL